MGAAFGWSVPMAYAAQSDSLPKMAWLLYVATLVWAVAYDTIYSIVDRDDYLRIGVKSTAILFGDFDRLLIGLFQGLFVVAMLLVGVDLNFSAVYFVALAIAILLLVFFSSMLLHVFGDLPLHHDDAHRHFFPFSDWRFVSPVSYWDPAHHGQWAGLIELTGVVAAATFMYWRRALLRPWVSAITAIYLLYWVYVLLVWS
jgi:hypothetical protein